MKKATEKYLKITKIKKRKYQEKYWNKNLEAERQKINFWSKRFRETNLHEDYCV